MDTCKQIEIFKNNLIDIINNSHLTIGCALYVIKDVFNDVEKEYIKVLNSEYSERTENNSQNLDTNHLIETGEEEPTFLSLEEEEEKEEE